MASISEAEAQYFSVAAPPCRIAVHERVTDQLFGRIPFVYVGGHALNVAYVSGSGLDAYGNFSTSFPTVNAFELSLTHYSTVLEVDSAVVGQYGNARDIVRTLIGVKVDALEDVLGLFEFELEESVDQVTWTVIDATAPPAGTEATLSTDLSRTWLRAKVRLNAASFPVVTCYAVGFLVKRRS